MDTKEYNHAYYVKHGSELRKGAKERYAANATKYRKDASDNYVKNKTAIKERVSRIIPCPNCHRPITASNKSKHMKTKSCKIYTSLI